MQRITAYKADTELNFRVGTSVSTSRTVCRPRTSQLAGMGEGEFLAGIAR